jgi:deoxyribodipyrimidine photolyase-related protein
MTEAGDPVGGEWNLDEQNREPLPDDVQLPELIDFKPDDLTREVMEEVNGMPSGYGSVENFSLAVTHQQAESAAKDFFDRRLANFGTYEDAMRSNEPVLFHSKLSPYLNLGLLDPLDLAREAEERYHSGQAPLNSVEGFIRQIIGWREYIYWQYWRTMPWIKEENFFSADRVLPEFFWTAETDMNCMRSVLKHAHKNGYNHHIERLMVLSNYCLLAGLDPRQVLNWFMASYIDAYEWVMVPNVLGMGIYADGGLTSTKPYAASANYINKMSDYCQNCSYYRTKRLGDDACPFNSLYWNFMMEHEATLRQNPRMGTSLLGLRHFEADERQQIRAQAARHLARLHG